MRDLGSLLGGARVAGPPIQHICHFYLHGDPGVGPAAVHAGFVRIPDLLTAGRRGGDFVSCLRLFMVGCLDKGGIVTIADCRGSALLADNPAYPQSEIQYLVSAHGTLDTHALCVPDLFPLHILEGIISTVIESANKLNAARWDR
jgi:hypothetical protein